MKSNRNIIGAVFLFIGLVAASCASTSPNPVRTQKMKQVLESKNFIFRPETVRPATGTKMDLATGRFTVRLLEGTLVADLPYVGRDYSSIVDRDEVNIKFNTTDFTYDLLTRKNNRWEVTIRPQGAAQVSDMVFDVYDSGAATLKVSSNTRQSVTFTGYIVENIRGAN